MAKEIKEIYMGRMNNGAHFVYVDDVATRAEANPTLMEKCPELVTALRSAVKKEDECLKITNKSFHSDKIAEGDQKRGIYYGGYRRVVKGFLSVPDEEMANAAVILDQQMTDYGIDPQMQIDRETGLLTNFIEDLEGKYAEYVELLGLTPFVVGMKEANEMVRINKVERREERAATMNGALKAARKVSDDAYRALVKYVNALNLLDGNADTAGFIDYVNTLIEEFKREVLGTATDSPAASDNVENAPSTDNDDGDTTPDEGETETPDTGGTEDGGETPTPDAGEDDGEVVG